MEDHFVTSCDTAIDWDAPTTDLINEINGEEDQCACPVMNISTAIDYIGSVKQFVRAQGFTSLLADLSVVECKLEQKFMLQQQNAIQSLVTDYFVPNM